MEWSDVLVIAKYKQRCASHALVGFTLNLARSHSWHTSPTAVFRIVKEQYSEMKDIFTFASFVAIANAMGPPKSKTPVARHNGDYTAISYGMLLSKAKAPSILTSQSRLLPHPQTTR